MAAALAVGAVWILLTEYWRPQPKVEGIDSLTWREALYIGLFQCLSLWPGMSRAASTILGGMISGVERKTATEYSFFAAVPIMIAATVFELHKSYAILSRALPNAGHRIRRLVHRRLAGREGLRLVPRPPHARPVRLVSARAGGRCAVVRAVAPLILGSVHSSLLKHLV